MAFKRRFSRSHSRRNFRSRPRFRRHRKAGIYLLGTKFSMLSLAVLAGLAYLFTPLKQVLNNLLSKK